MSTEQDHYEVLGVARDASQQDIRYAWRRLTLKFHPDRAQFDEKSRAEAEEMTRAINSAYECLGDVERRKLYDEGRPEEYKLDQDAKDVMLMAVSSAVTNNNVINVASLLNIARDTLLNELFQRRDQKSQLDMQVSVAQKAVKKIRRKAAKPGADLVAIHLGNMLANLGKVSSDLGQRINILERALTMLDDYEEVADGPPSFRMNPLHLNV